jgi:hypothetical protein
MKKQCYLHNMLYLLANGEHCGGLLRKFAPGSMVITKKSGKGCWQPEMSVMEIINIDLPVF